MRKSQEIKKAAVASATGLVLFALLSPGSVARGGVGASLREILAGRAQLGLSVDDVDVASLSFSSAWGVFLSASELQLLDERLAIQGQLGPARDIVQQHADTAIGVYFDQDAAGALTVATVDGASADLIGSIVDALPSGTEFRTVVGTRSLADLRALQAQIVTAADHTGSLGGVPVSAVGIDAMHDAVSVLTPLSADVATTALAESFGAGVEVQVGSVTPTACTTVYNCIPIRGGLEMLNPLHPGYWQCSTGFNARPTATSSIRYVLSAGHCWRDETDNTFIHNGNSFGTARFSPFQRTTGTHYSDSLLITRNSYGTGTPMNTVFIPNDTSAYTITGQVNLINQNVGDYVCNTGVNASASRCGYITVDNDVIDNSPGGRWGSTTWSLFGQERASFGTDLGDSGGPVYILHKAYGIAWAHIDSTHSEYSPIDQIQNDMSNFGGINFRLCFNSSCT